MNLNENYNSQQIIGYCKFACAASESAHACNSCTTSNLLCHPEIEPSLRLQLEASEICSPIDKREIVLGLNKWTFSTIHTPCTFGMQRRSRERSWAPRELKNCYGKQNVRPYTQSCSTSTYWVSYCRVESRTYSCERLFRLLVLRFRLRDHTL